MGFKRKNNYKVVGDIVYVELPRCEQPMICDLSDWEELKDRYWTLSQSGYAYTSWKENEKCCHCFFHIFLMGKTDNKVTDHINRNKLDNRRCNLRVVSRRINNLNVGMQKNNTSGIKGVTFDKFVGRWKASICVNYKSINLGRYDTVEEAAKARKEAEDFYYKPLLE